MWAGVRWPPAKKRVRADADAMASGKTGGFFVAKFAILEFSLYFCNKSNLS
jgi:hypothetical protein